MIKSAVMGLALLGTLSAQAFDIEEAASALTTLKSTNQKEALTPDFQHKMFVFSLWSAYQDGNIQKYEEKVSELFITDYPHYLAMRLGFLKLHLGKALTQEEIQYLYDGKEWDHQSKATFESLQRDFSTEQFLADISLDNQKNTAFKRTWSKGDIAELIDFTPKWKAFDNKYRKVPRLYVFCREQRKFPCLMVMKNKDGDLVRKSNGEVWSQPKLAKSSRGYNYDQVNGNTPQGLFKVESVMPKADQNLLYGKYRRLILDFVGRSKDEKDMKRYLPDFVHGDSWWQENVTARDLGRQLFRIHGVGRRSLNPLAAYYPFVPTSGCIASLEGTYKGVEYNDQRELLDRFMVAQELEPIYKNEKELRGMVYIVNIDDEERAVELDDIL